MSILNKMKIAKGPAFDSVLLTIIQIVTYITNLIITKLLSIKLSLYEYGTYSTVNSIVTIAASFTLFGLGDSLNYFFNKRDIDATEKKEKVDYVNTIFFIQFIIGIIVGVLLIVFSSGISNYYNNSLVDSLVIIVCLKPLVSNATHLYQVLFVSSGKAKLIAIRNLVVSFLKIILLVISINIFKTLSAIFFCLVLLDVIQLVFFKKIFGNISFNINIFKFRKILVVPIIKYAIPMGVYFVTTTLMREIDKLVIGRLGTTEELAVYSNCARTLPVNILVLAFATVLIPYITKNISCKDYKNATNIMRNYMAIGYLSVWMLSAALLVTAPEVIRFFYSEDYIEGLPVFVIYIIDGMVQFASVHLVVAASGNSKFLMKLSIILMILNAIISIILYYVFSIWNIAMIGPALATVIISIVYNCVLLNKSCSILQVKISNFLPFKKMILYILELIIIGVPIYLIRKYLNSIGVNWIIIIFLSCGCYCALISLLHIREYKNLFLNINELKNKY